MRQAHSFQMYHWLHQNANSLNEQGLSYAVIANKASEALGFHVGHESVSKLIRDSGLQIKTARLNTITKKRVEERLDELEEQVRILQNIVEKHVKSYDQHRHTTDGKIVLRP